MTRLKFALLTFGLALLYMAIGAFVALGFVYLSGHLR